MPRIKADQTLQAAARFEGLLARGRMHQGLTIREMCKRVGFSERKYEILKQTPEKYKIEEIRSFSRVVGVSVRELITALVPSVGDGE